MQDPNAVFQNCFYVGNTFNAMLYGTFMPALRTCVPILIGRMWHT